MADKQEDPSMAKVKALFEQSGLSMNDLGLKMGFAAEVARQSVFQFMKSGDPRIGTLRRFAKAIGIEIEELVGEEKRKRK
jgi:transcriptional regulator with XRE-family HTH domain